jgi:DNA-binding protein HU-beta
MNKKELTESLVKKFELSKTTANEIIAHLIELMSKSLVKGDAVQLIGFGSFSVRKRKARWGVNPSTREKIKIPASKAIRFSAG